MFILLPFLLILLEIAKNMFYFVDQGRVKDRPQQDRMIHMVRNHLVLM